MHAILLLVCLNLQECSLFSNDYCLKSLGVLFTSKIIALWPLSALLLRHNAIALQYGRISKNTINVVCRNPFVVVNENKSTINMWKT